MKRLQLLSYLTLVLCIQGLIEAHVPRASGWNHRNFPLRFTSPQERPLSLLYTDRGKLQNTFREKPAEQKRRPNFFRFEDYAPKFGVAEHPCWRNYRHNYEINGGVPRYVSKGRERTCGYREAPEAVMDYRLYVTPHTFKRKPVKRRYTRQSPVITYESSYY